MDRAKVSNADVAKLLGLTHSAVSRIRSGDRMPSLPVMMNIAVEFDWDLKAQATFRYLGIRYAMAFETRLIKIYGKEEPSVGVKDTPN